MSEYENLSKNKKINAAAIEKCEFYHIQIKSNKNFKRFRTHKVGGEIGIERVGGQRADGCWETIKWLVSKDLAHIANGKLIADHEDVKELFAKLGFVPIHIEGNRFEMKK